MKQPTEMTPTYSIKLSIPVLRMHLCRLFHLFPSLKKSDLNHRGGFSDFLSQNPPSETEQLPGSSCCDIPL